MIAEKKTTGKSTSTQKDENNSFKQGTDAGKFQSETSQSKNCGKPGTFSKIFRLEGIRKLWRGKKSTLALLEPTVSNAIKDDQQSAPVGNESTSDEIVNLKINDENSNRKGSDAGYHSVLSHSNSVKRLEAKLSSHSQRRPDNQLVTNFSKRYKGKLDFIYKITKPGRFGKFWKGSNSHLVPEGQQEDKPVPKFEGFGENGAPSVQNNISEVFEGVRCVRKDEERNDSTELVRTRSVRKSTERNNSTELVRIRTVRKSTELRLHISRPMRSTDLL